MINALTFRTSTSRQATARAGLQEGEIISRLPSCGRNKKTYRDLRSSGSRPVPASQAVSLATGAGQEAGKGELTLVMRMMDWSAMTARDSVWESAGGRFVWKEIAAMIS